MLRTLAEYHQRIEAMMAEGDALLAARDPAASERAKQKCADAALLIGAYQLHVHRELFQPMLASGDPVQRARAADLKTECIALTEDLRFRVRDLMAREERELDWDALAQAVAWFNRRVRDHVAHVERAMAPTMTAGERAAFRHERRDAVGPRAA